MNTRQPRNKDAGTGISDFGTTTIALKSQNRTPKSQFGPSITPLSLTAAFCAA